MLADMYLDWHLILNGVAAFLIGSWIVSLTKPRTGDGFWATQMLFRKQDKEREARELLKRFEDVRLASMAQYEKDKVPPFMMSATAMVDENDQFKIPHIPVVSQFE